MVLLVVTILVAPQCTAIPVKVSASISSDEVATLPDKSDTSNVTLEILLDLYKSTGGANWYNNTGWEALSPDYCQWFGITCAAFGIILKIDLSQNQLTGTTWLSHKSELA